MRTADPPLSFARYIARSAACIKDSASSPSSGKQAAPPPVSTRSRQRLSKSKGQGPAIQQAGWRVVAGQDRTDRTSARYDGPSDGSANSEDMTRAHDDQHGEHDTERTRVSKSERRRMHPGEHHADRAVRQEPEITAVLDRGRTCHSSNPTGSVTDTRKSTLDRKQQDDCTRRPPTGVSTSALACARRS